MKPTGYKSLAPLFLLSDEPIDGDSADDLGRDDDARLLAELVLGTRGPFTVGVYGDWGIGKTSLLYRIRHLLSVRDEKGDLEYPYIVPVFFNAWQFENEDKPLAHLAEAIEDAVVLRLKDMESLTTTIKDKAVGWLRSVHLAMRSAIFGVSIDTGMGFAMNAKDAIERNAELIKEQEDAKSTAWKEQIDKSVTISALRSMRANDAQLDQVRPGEEKRVPRVVVFVDDMDRCSSKDAFKILQGIKLAFAQPGFVFLLSLNPETLRPYIADRGQEAKREDRDLSEAIYLDKLVQLPYPLKLRDDQFLKFSHVLIEERLKNLVSNEQHALFKDLRGALRDSSDRNPRTLKRRINAMIVDARQAPATLLKRLDDDDAKARADFMGLSLLEQTARHLGKPGLLSQLSEGPGLCELIIRDGLRPTFKRLREVRAAEQKRQRTIQGGGSHAGATDAEAATILQYADLLTGLNAVSPLDGLFRASFGQRWLADAAIREEFSRFLALRPVEMELQSVPAPQTAARTEQASKDRPAASEEERAAAFKKDVQRFKQRERRKKRKESTAAPQADLLLSDAERAIIERAVREALQIREDRDLTRDDWGRVAELNLSGEELTDGGVAFLARADSGLKSLTTLKLGRTKVTDAGLIKLASHNSGLKALCDLDLEGTQLTAVALREFARPDTGLSILTSLNLNGTPITDEGLKVLADTHTGLDALRSLFVAFTRVTDAGIKEISKADTGLRSLTELTYGATVVTDDGLIELARPETGLKLLSKLNVSSSGVTDLGLSALARNDTGLKSLIQLFLWHTKLTDAGLKELSRANMGLKLLSMLDLCDTGITDAGLHELCQAESGLKNLVKLGIGDTQVTDIGIKAVQERWPNVRIYKRPFFQN